MSFAYKPMKTTILAVLQTSSWYAYQWKFNSGILLNNLKMTQVFVLVSVQFRRQWPPMMVAMVMTFLIICLGDYGVGKLLLRALWNGSSSPSGFERGSGRVQSSLSSQTLKLTRRSAMPYICRLPRSIWFCTIKSEHTLVTLMMFCSESELHDTPKQKINRMKKACCESL